MTSGVKSWIIAGFGFAIGVLVADWVKTTVAGALNRG